MTALRSTRLALVAATALATACGDAPVSKLAARAPALSAGSYPETEHTAGRRAPLAQAITRSVDVDHKGGRVEIKEAGFRLTIPKNAIRANAGVVRISVTVLPGNVLAYELQPSGMSFDRPLELEQDLEHLVKDARVDPRAAPQVSYFKSPADLDAAAGTVKSYEDLPAGIDVSGHKLKADVRHFSGYIVSWGFR